MSPHAATVIQKNVHITQYMCGFAHRYQEFYI